MKTLTQATSDRRINLIRPGAVLALTFVVFIPTLWFDFVFDDRLQILQNPYILSWHYLPQYFTANVWSFNPGSFSNYYRPLFLVWFRLNDALFGLRPAGWHFASVLIHVVVTLEVYWVGLKLMKDRGVAAVAAALFGVHPIHTESVAWVSGVPDPLVAALMLASLLAYFRFREGGRRGWLWFTLSLLAYAGATLSKETALIFPAVIFTYEWLWHPATTEGARQGRLERFRHACLRALPYLAVSVGYLAARIHALGVLSDNVANVPLRAMVLTWPSLLWFYTHKLLWPLGLSPFYDTPYVKAFSARSVLAPAVIVALVVALLGVWAHHAATSSEGLEESRTVAFSAVWLGLPFLTLLNLTALQPGEFAKDRYLYVPSIGAAWLAATGWRHLRDRTTIRAGAKVARGVAIAVCLVLGALTMRQSSFWTNDLVLFTRACAIAPRSPYALGNMALAAYQQGYPVAALKLFRQAVEADPANERLSYNMAITEFDLGRLAESDRDLLVALRLAPQDATAMFALGKVRFAEGRLADAADLMRNALRLYPTGRGYHLALGEVLEKSGDLGGALQEYSAEIATNPDEPDAPKAARRVQALSAAQNPENATPGSNHPQIPAGKN